MNRDVLESPTGYKHSLFSHLNSIILKKKKLNRDYKSLPMCPDKMGTCWFAVSLTLTCLHELKLCSVVVLTDLRWEYESLDTNREMEKQNWICEKSTGFCLINSLLMDGKTTSASLHKTWPLKEKGPQPTPSCLRLDRRKPPHCSDISADNLAKAYQVIRTQRNVCW